MSDCIVREFNDGHGQVIIFTDEKARSKYCSLVDIKPEDQGDSPEGPWVRK